MAQLLFVCYYGARAPPVRSGSDQQRLDRLSEFHGRLSGHRRSWPPAGNAPNARIARRPTDKEVNLIFSRQA